MLGSSYRVGPDLLLVCILGLMWEGSRSPCMSFYHDGPQYLIDHVYTETFHIVSTYILISDTDPIVKITLNKVSACSLSTLEHSKVT